MAHGDRRKCKCCLKLFRPDPRSRHHQRYCSVPGLQNGQQSRQPSTLARQTRERRLLPRLDKRRPGPRVAVAPSGLLAQGSTCRRCVTRSLLTAQPIGSASETNKTAHTPLQDLIIAQPVGFANETASSSQTQLQEILLAQRAVLIGLIAHIVGTTFEEMLGDPFKPKP